MLRVNKSDIPIKGDALQLNCDWSVLFDNFQKQNNQKIKMGRKFYVIEVGQAGEGPYFGPYSYRSDAEIVAGRLRAAIKAENVYQYDMVTVHKITQRDPMDYIQTLKNQDDKDNCLVCGAITYIKYADGRSSNWRHVPMCYKHYMEIKCIDLQDPSTRKENESDIEIAIKEYINNHYTDESSDNDINRNGWKIYSAPMPPKSNGLKKRRHVKKR